MFISLIVTFGNFSNNLIKWGFDLLVLQTAPFKVGIPVPLFFWKMVVGGAVINFGFTDYRITGNQGYTFVSKGSGSGSGGSGGGGGGGGSRGGGDSDWRQEIVK